MLPGPEKTSITRAEGGYVVAWSYRPKGKKTPVKVTKIAADEFELRGIIGGLFK